MLETDVDKAVLMTLRASNLCTLSVWCGSLTKFTYIGHGINETSQWRLGILRFTNVGCGQVNHGAIAQETQVSM